MAISLRKRGDIWYARGTVRVGRETITVREFSTGCGTRADAAAAAGAEEARIRAEHLDGPAGRARGVTIAACILAYLNRPQGVALQQAAKFEALSEAIGHHTLGKLHEAWGDWRQAHRKHAAATSVRYRALLMAAVRYHCKAERLPAPELPAIEVRQQERIAMLTAPERRRLLAAYSPHAACPVLLLAHQGMRTQEVLRLDWRDVDLEQETIRAGVRAGSRATKSRRGRAIPMHPHVARLLVGMWHAAGEPSEGPVFLSQRGKPYADTEDTGGNPLRAAHRTACTRARIRDFRVHDWRHDWAARMVMAGVDLFTLMRLGGWSSLKMVEKYGAVSADHLREAIRKIA